MNLLKDIKFKCVFYREGEKLPGFGGFAVSISNKSVVANTSPCTAFIFNFQAPIYGKPSLLTFKDVQILFQKASMLFFNLKIISVLYNWLK